MDVKKLFSYDHLPVGIREVSKIFYEAAVKYDESVESSAEKTLTLRKLWEAKNLAVLSAPNSFIKK